MNNELYPNFLTDAVAYAKSEQLWSDKWGELVRRRGQEQSWTTPWMNTRFSNGTPFGDGNPIFSAVCHSRARGIRVIQLPRSEGQSEFSFWVDVFAPGGPEETKELVIVCVLTNDTLAQAMDLFAQWLSAEAEQLHLSGPASPGIANVARLN